MGTPEPVTVAPEKKFESEIIGAIHAILDESGCEYLVVPRFGVDIGVVIRNASGTRVRFLEVKCFNSARAGGVGFGNGGGTGLQIEILLHPVEAVRLLDDVVRWILVDATRPPGSPRYALFTCSTAKAAAMGGVAPGKQNNLRLSAFADRFITWAALIDELRGFLTH